MTFEENALTLGEDLTTPPYELQRKCPKMDTIFLLFLGPFLLRTNFKVVVSKSIPEAQLYTLTMLKRYIVIEGFKQTKSPTKSVILHPLILIGPRRVYWAYISITKMFLSPDYNTNIFTLFTMTDHSFSVPSWRPSFLILWHPSFLLPASPSSIESFIPTFFFLILRKLV